MPRFYFHLFNNAEDRDPDGDELSNLAAARTVAELNARFTAAMTSEEVGRLKPDNRIVIADENGNVLDTVYFADVAASERGPLKEPT